ncbi:hypothetical protein [Streptomyces sp. WM6378]|uniref:hypothetical protein n=1 Tax=Streptomyces sp. WM6378 TaxID=1415557 RepID=UPI0006ADCD2D|nr:hypothetical protein [Streptomyces sp. WM6378]KOU36490.1 hypothetical protein ADK54_33365 [Streptomyces sp. WM6378]
MSSWLAENIGLAVRLAAPADAGPSEIFAAFLKPHWATARCELQSGSAFGDGLLDELAKAPLPQEVLSTVISNSPPAASSSPRRHERDTSVPIIDQQREAMLGLGSDWWLYVVLDGKTAPVLVVVREPSRLLWRLITPLRELPEGQYRGVGDEGRWHTMPSDGLAVGEQVDVPM